MKRLFAFAALLLASCSSDIDVRKFNPNQPYGVPFRIAETQALVSWQTALAKGGKCEFVQKVEWITVPSRELYGMNVKGDALAKLELTVKLYDNGTLQEAGFKSDNTAAIQAAKDVALKVADIAGRESLDGAEPACDSGSQNACLLPLERLDAANIAACSPRPRKEA